jgi:ureidoacrylate peracid hydrolase
MLKDATASFSDEEMHAALEVNVANYAIVTNEVVDLISSLET